MDALTLLKFKTPFAQELPRYLSASCSRVRALISCLAHSCSGRSVITVNINFKDENSKASDYKAHLIELHVYYT
jgi:hypothetical protein